MIRKTLCVALVGSVLLSAAASLQATERRFTYTYEATTAPKGTFELENWATWKATRAHRNEKAAHEFDFRHELEYGITDRLQVGLYLANWRLVDDDDHRRSARYESSAVELIYQLSNPATDFIGSALYGEVGVGTKSLTFEGKLILQKNFGPWVVAYNATVEHESEGTEFGDYEERTGEFQQTLGISYEVKPQFTIGAEVLHEIEFPEWEDAEDSVVYAGPNASFRGKNWSLTVTPLIQLTNIEAEPDVQTRVIFGIGF